MARATNVELPVLSRASRRRRRERVAHAAWSSTCRPARRRRRRQRAAGGQRSERSAPPTKSRSCPAITTSCASSPSCARSAARSGPTLTHVPVESLKSSDEPAVEDEALAPDRRDRRSAARRRAGRSLPRRTPRAVSAVVAPVARRDVRARAARASSLSPTGASFSSTPGTGTPMRPPAEAPRSPAQSANGALSVAPRPVTSRISLAAARRRASSLQLVGDLLAAAPAAA